MKVVIVVWTKLVPSKTGACFLEVVAVSRKMFKTMRCFRTHAQRKRISGGAKGVRFVRIYLPQFDFLFCCCLYKVFFFFSPCCG